MFREDWATVITDYFIAVEAITLLYLFSTRASKSVSFAFAFKYNLIWSAISSAAGAIYHQYFESCVECPYSELLWRFCCASVCFSDNDLHKKAWIRGLLFIPFGICGLLQLQEANFRLSVKLYSGAVLLWGFSHIVSACYGFLDKRSHIKKARLVQTGFGFLSLLCVLISGYVQTAKIGLAHWFNHNALAHVFFQIALLFMFKAAGACLDIEKPMKQQ